MKILEPKRIPFRFKSGRLAALIIFVTVMFTYSAFIQPESPNSTSRLGWILNLIQKGDPSLNGYAALTIDKSIYDGQYYSDKAPGLSLIAVPAVSVFTYFKHINPNEYGTPAWVLMRYIATLSTIGLLSALTAALIFRNCLTKTGHVTAAMFATILFSIGSPIFGWSTLFFGHAAIACILIITTITSEYLVARALYIQASIATGVFLGFAALVEYTSVIPGAFIALQVIGQTVQSDRTKSYKIKSISIMLIVGISMLIPALIYNLVCFGNPFRVGYGYVAGFENMKSGFYGIGMPDLAVAGELLFGTYRGLLWICPASIVMAIALIYGIKQRDTRRLAITAAIIFVYYLGLNSAYAYWNGGFSTGPRHLVPALGLPILVVARVWKKFSTPTKILATFLLVQSIIINLAATTVLMMAPYWLDNPVLGYILPYFFQNPEWRSLLLILLWISALFLIGKMGLVEKQERLNTQTL